METSLTSRSTGLTITKEKAAYLLKQAWPDAPDAEVLKAAIICQQYKFHPFMKRVYLIPFTSKATNKTTWSVVLGIGATRQMVQAKHKYGFADGPRIMTEEEQQQTFGKIYTTDIVAVVKLEDPDGLVYPGYGRWPKASTPKGVEKGNSCENMAFIRAERNALDKLAPGELPDFDVTDESYEDQPATKVIEEGKREAIEQAQGDIKDFWPEPEEPADVESLRRRIVDTAIAKEKVADVKDFMVEQFGVGTTKELNQDQAKDVLKMLEGEI